MCRRLVQHLTCRQAQPSLADTNIKCPAARYHDVLATAYACNTPGVAQHCIGRPVLAPALACDSGSVPHCCTASSQAAAAPGTVTVTA